MAHRYKTKTKKKRRKKTNKWNHTRNVSLLVIVNTELPFVVDVVDDDDDDDVLLLPIRLSIVNEVFDFWLWWIIGIVGGGGGRIGNGGGSNGKHRFIEDAVGTNGNGIGGNDGGPPVGAIGPWWKHAEWWWWWFKRLKRLRRRKNEPLSNIFSLAGSNVQ